MDDFKRFYKTNAWVRCREGYVKSVGGLCEECIKHDVYTVGEIVHHKQPITASNANDPNVTLNWDNLELLCRRCHAKKHGSKKRYKVDDMGYVIMLPDAD